ncbi:unnamed protein product [Dicrocoelium dendriticum]|nr:unnamed protein product [Dicrocoelium dendriticum]
MDASNLEAMEIRLIPLWLPHSEREPPLKMGTITERLQSVGTVSCSHSFTSNSCKASTRAEPPNLKRAGGRSSGPAALFNFNSPISRSTSEREGGSKGTAHGAGRSVTGESNNSCRLNCFSKCSAQRSRRFDKLWIGCPLSSRIVSLTPGLLLPVSRIRRNNLRWLPRAAATSISDAR